MFFYGILNFLLKFLLVNASGSPNTVSNDVLDPTYQALTIILPVAIGMILGVGTLYAIVLGVQYSKAENADDRNKAKKRLVNAIIGFGIVLVLALILFAIREPLGNFIDQN